MSAALPTTFTTLPFTQLRRNRHFYLYYDAFYAVLCAVAIAAMQLSGFQGLLTDWKWWYLAFFPLVTYVVILGHVFAHVCTHNSFPRPWNRIIGEICGLIVITRFASWEIVHQRHHRYSDDVAKDPHPCMPSYWKHVLTTVVNVEKQLQQTFYDLYGDNAENRAFERKRAWVSYLTNILLIVAWYKLVGFYGFMLLLPASILAALHLFHFNWSTHNAMSPTRDYKPVNLNHGLFRLGNKMFFGIYMHANHHKKANILNPTYVTPSLPITPPPTREEIEAARAGAAT